MRICYVLISATWGMHQYTADLANRMHQRGHQVHLVTTRHLPRDRYAPAVGIETPVSTTKTGMAASAKHLAELRALRRTILDLRPDIVHLTGPHPWNPLLLHALRWAQVPTVHTLHDLHPHAGTTYGRWLYLWNGWIRGTADHLLVHGQRFRRELLAKRVAPSRVTCTPLTHLFVSHDHEHQLRQSPVPGRYEPWALFLGRLEVYKGLDVLVQAVRESRLTGENAISLVIAGRGDWQNLVSGTLPKNIEIRPRLISDEEAIDLFGRCGLLVLPYIEASQSALAAAAYFFCKPVVVTAVGALPEYVIEGETGWVIHPNDPHALGEVLKEALGDPAQLAQMGQAGRAWYEQQRRAEEATLERMYAAL